MKTQHYYLCLAHSRLSYRQKLYLLKHFDEQIEHLFLCPHSQLKQFFPRLQHPLNYYIDHHLVDNIEQQLQRNPQYHLITYADANYPHALKQIKDPPLVLYCHGHTDILNNPQISIVGTRHPSHYGRETAHNMAKALADKGFTITSGLASGVDSCAHRGALNSQLQPSTIAVLGTGIDVCYPKSNQCLAQAISENGVLISEFPLQTPPLPNHFPRRNRLISGLSYATLIIEASLKSGSLITARLAGDQGREVFAIPGSIHTPQAKGCHALIKQGAKLVENTDDILYEIKDLISLPSSEITTEVKHQCNMNSRFDLTNAHESVLNCVDFSSTSLDLIIQRSGLKPENVCSTLLLLELGGYIKKDMGNQYIKVS